MGKLLDWLTKTKTPKGSWLDDVGKLRLVPGSFTHSLVVLGARSGDNAEKELNEIGSPFVRPTNKAEHVQESAVTVCYQIVTLALREIGRPEFFGPNDKIPKDAHAIVAFGLIVLSAIYGQLESEQSNLDVNAAAISFASGLFPFAKLRKDQKWVESVMMGQALFKQIAAANERNVKELISNTHEATRIFVYAKAKNEHDFETPGPLGKAFGMTLKNVLRAVQA